MNLKELTKPLSIEDIDFRIQSINKGKYATILAYKDARVDMKRLDEVCGPGKWTREHKEVNGVIYCAVGIYIDEINMFVYKQDAGTESMTEAQKGAASDSFKRACFNWGIGRELYDYPLISVRLNDDEVQAQPNGKYKASWNLKLKEWKWYIETDEDGKVLVLGARDQNGNVRFNYQNK
jgi:hypothetical protein